MKSIFSYKGWLKDEFIGEEDIHGQPITNDSSRYIELVDEGKMTTDDYISIRTAQQKTYDYILERTLNTNKIWLQRELSHSKFHRRLIQLKIDQINKSIEIYPNVYSAVVNPIKKYSHGSAFILAEEYEAMKKGQYLDAYIFHYSKYQLQIEGKLESFPTIEQRRYIRMEADINWLEYLLCEPEKLLESTPKDQLPPSLKPLEIELYRGTDDRDFELIELVCKGKSQSQIADLLYLSVETIKKRYSNLKELTQTNSIQEAINVFISHGLVKHPPLNTK